ncbi:helix-turn-helix transcriptional regulator [Saccharicrinis aurantiacus]|uniref:helix-turn-helix transcriptional regulator n=1 Tax=Saccharicrinis aurantiacus TaxID=1849719 RepID=UPI00094FA6A4|nr:helix-turn-helix domain-containing protein [Saccharicrinis aurantiacus]
MTAQEKLFPEMQKSLDKLNNQMSELIRLQRRSTTGYDYVNVTELAQLLGESIHTVYSRVHLKQIPYYKPGGKALLFKMCEIHDWIIAGRHTPIDELIENI